MFRPLLLALSVMTLCACTQRIGDLTFVTSKNIGYTYPALRRSVRGLDCAQSILFIPWGSLRPNVEEAVDRAVDQVPDGDMLINAAVHNDILITLLYNRNCIRVDGDVVNTAAPR
jgi:hypothetical protein